MIGNLIGKVNVNNLEKLFIFLLKKDMRIKMVDIEIVTRLNRLWATIHANTYDGRNWLIKAGYKSAGVIPHFLVTDCLFKIKSSQLIARVITYD